ncbi:MAG: ABC transporter permease [Clostridiales bacterium]|nr:ABC transporter permease [Clostridiales bacterium]
MLTNFLNALPSTLEQGLIYAVLALGILITYDILDFPDLTVDGSFPLGGAVSTTLLLRGAHPLVALCGALAAGAAAGLCTGLIHVKLKVRDLFSGIIMMTGLYSINLHIAGGSALMSIGKKQTTLFRNNPLADGLGDAATLVIVLLVVAVCKVLLDLFLKTRAGYLLRAAGDNETVVTALAKDRGTVKIGGLMLANALAALSGGILCQQQRLFEISMGTGAMVLGLASVIIGLNLFRKVSFIRSTTAVVVGAIVYKLCVSLAISCGLGASDLKLITALLFLLILASGALRQGRRNRKTGKGAANHA